MKKKIAIVSEAHSQECRSILTALGRHEAASREWTAFLDHDLRCVSDRAWFAEQRFDGVVHNHPSRELPRLCQELGIPCVDLDDASPPAPGAPKARRDNVAIGRLAAEHLSGLGYRAFAYYGYAGCNVSRMRRAGFADALRGSARTRDAAPYALERARPNSVSKSGYASDEDEIQLLKDWIQRLPIGVAVLACDDARAAAVLEACARAERRCPDEIAALGVGNDPVICDLAVPGLSSIDLNGAQRGKRAAEALQRLMEDPAASREDLPATPPLEIVERGSADGAAVPDAALARALAYIRDSARHGLRIEDLAAQSRTSRRILERRFQKHLGKTPNAAIREALVSKIKLLLASSDKPLSEIAYETGFAHPEYMNVVFKKCTGATPGAYRRAHAARSRAS